MYYKRHWCNTNNIWFPPVGNNTFFYKRIKNSFPFFSISIETWQPCSPSSCGVITSITLSSDLLLISSKIKNKYLSVFCFLQSSVPFLLHQKYQAMLYVQPLIKPAHYSVAILPLWEWVEILFHLKRVSFVITPPSCKTW